MKITSNEKACKSAHWRRWIALWWLTGEKCLFSLISSRGHCQRSSPLRICDTPRAIFEPAQNLSSNFVEWNCAVVITTTLHYHFFYRCSVKKPVLKNFAALKEKKPVLAFRPATVLKRDSITGVSLWILRNS